MDEPTKCAEGCSAYYGVSFNVGDGEDYREVIVMQRGRSREDAVAQAAWWINRNSRCCPIDFYRILGDLRP